MRMARMWLSAVRLLSVSVTQTAKITKAGKACSKCHCSSCEIICLYWLAEGLSETVMCRYEML
jgi:hypothetical protein